MMDPIGAYLLVSHAWGHPLAPWGTINGIPILDIAGDNMPLTLNIDTMPWLTQGVGPVDASDALGYATRLATSLWEKHYRDIAPDWKPLPDLMGVLTQIDNMTCGLMRRRKDDGLGAPENPAV